MKLTLGTVVLNQRALVKNFITFLLVSITIGVQIAVSEEGRPVPIVPFLPIYAVIIPMLIRGIGKEINSERMSQI